MSVPEGLTFARQVLTTWGAELSAELEDAGDADVRAEIRAHLGELRQAYLALGRLQRRPGGHDHG